MRVCARISHAPLSACDHVSVRVCVSGSLGLGLPDEAIDEYCSDEKDDHKNSFAADIADSRRQAL